MTTTHPKLVSSLALALLLAPLAARAAEPAAATKPAVAPTPPAAETATPVKPAVPAIHGAATPPLATCGTCHRGVSRPRKIEDVFEDTRAASGLPAAISQYKEMRTASLVNGNYDFSARPLNRQARRQLQAKDSA